MIIRRIVMHEVKVPARPDSINSPETDHALHKLPTGGKKGWTKQFDTISKTILQVHLDNGIVGLGETYRGISRPILDDIANELLHLDLAEANLQDLPIPSGRVYDGFECAIFDAVAKSHDMPLYQWLGGRFRDRIHCSAWSGHRTIPDAVRKAREAQAAGFDCIKFKCTLQDPVVAWCEGIAETCGKGFGVILDPNERFDHPSHAERIAHQLSPIGNVLYLEDPISRWDIESWTYLRSKVHVPLSMHISTPYSEMGQIPQDAARAARAQACDYFVFNGGIDVLRRLTALADLFEMPYAHGSEIDLGILEASYVHKCAAAKHATLPSDIFGRQIREHDLLQEPLTFEQGHVFVPGGAGLGVQLNVEALANYTVAHWEVEG